MPRPLWKHKGEDTGRKDLGTKATRSRLDASSSQALSPHLWKKPKQGPTFC